MQDKYEIEKSLETNTASMGLSKFDKIKLDMLEAVKFVEDNMICVQEYQESKNYIKNALFIWLRPYDKEMNKKSDEVFAQICNTRLTFTMQDILLFSKNCKKDNLRHFKDNIHFSNIPFKEVDKLQSYVIKLITFYKSKFKDDIIMTEYLWWRSLSLEIQMLLYISSYYLKNENVVTDIVEFIFDCTDGDWGYQDRMQTIKKYVTAENNSEISAILEKHLIDKVQKYKEKNDTEFNNIIEISETLALISSIWFSQLTAISSAIISMSKEDLELTMPAMIKLAPYFSADAKEIVVDKYEITNVWHLIEKCKADTTFDFTNYIYLIDKFFQKEITENSVPGVTKYTIPSQEEFVREVSFFIIENKIEMDTLSDYKGNWNEFDYFFNVNVFNSDNFEVKWLLYYSDKVLDYIRSNNTKLSITKNALRNMDKSKCKDCIERWLYLYRIFI